MPVLILAVSKYFDKLLEDGSLAATATLGVLCRIVVMAVNMSIVLVVAILSAEDSRAKRAGKVVDVVFAIEGRDVRTPKSSATLITQQA